MGMFLLVRGSDLTSIPYELDQQMQPERELRNSDDDKPNRDGDVFQRHSVYSVIRFRGISSEFPKETNP